VELAAILMARLSVWVEAVELAPRNQVGLVPLCERLRERYAFLQAPKALEDFNIASENGIRFASGRYETIAIEKLALFVNGIVVETRSSTDDCDALAADFLQWVQAQVNSGPPRLGRKLYFSQLVFYGNHLFGRFSEDLTDLSQWASERIGETMETTLPYSLSHIQFDFDQLTYKINPGSIIVARRDNAGFSEDKYFSSAPLRTADHVEFLKRFEVVLARG